MTVIASSNLIGEKELEINTGVIHKKELKALTAAVPINDHGFAHAKEAT